MNLVFKLKFWQQIESKLAVQFLWSQILILFIYMNIEKNQPSTLEVYYSGTNQEQKKKIYIYIYIY